MDRMEKELNIDGLLLGEQSSTKTKIEELLEPPPPPHPPTTVERLAKFMKPYMGYMFSVKPIIPNVIMMMASMAGMQLIRTNGLMPEIQGLDVILFWLLMAGLAWQVIIASAKTLLVPAVTIGGATWALKFIEAGGSLPIDALLIKAFFAIGIAGLGVCCFFRA